MTYKANSIVNVPVVATNNLTLFGETIYPIMNVSVAPVTTTVEGLPVVTVAAGSDGQVLGTATLSVVSTSGFSSSGGLYCQSSSAAISSIGYENTDATDFLQQYGQGGLLVAGYGVTTQNNVGTVDTTSNGLTLPQTTINIDSPDVTPPASGTMYIWTQSSSSGQVISYTSWVYVGPYYTFLGCSGGTTQLTGGGFGTGDLVFFTPYTTVTSPSAGTDLGTYIIYVNSTTGIPTPSGTSYIYSGGGQIGYTGITGGGTPSFTGCFNGSGTVHTGDPITLGFPYTPLPVASTAGFPTSGNLNGSIAYTGTTPTSFTGVTGGTGGTLSNGQDISLSTSCYWLGFPKGVPFTMGLRNILNSRLNPFLASASGNAASLISAETTIASGSNGQTLPQSVIYVASTTYYPPSGNLYITDSNGQEFIHYTSITGGGTPSFNGCTGGIGTLSTGDTVYPEFYNAVLTGLNNVTGIEQTGVATGNAGSISNNLGINSSSPIFINSTTAVGVTTSGTLPDPNNGSILWALTDYSYGAGSPNVISDGGPDSGNSVYFFVSDGYNVRQTQTFVQEYWTVSQEYVTDGFTFLEAGGNLNAYILSPSSLTSNFSVGLSPLYINVVIENSTSYTATIGYSTDNVSITGNSINIPPGEAFFVYGDSSIIFSPNVPGVEPTVVAITATNSPSGSPYHLIEESGSTYIVDNGGSAVAVTLPYMPANGTQYTFIDDTNTFSYANPFVLNAAAGISYGQDYFFNAISSAFPSGLVTSYGFTNQGESFTVEYSTVTSGNIGIWNVANSNEEISINSSNSPYTITPPTPDINGTTYLVDATGSSLTINLPATPADGTQYTFKDENQTWSNTFSVTITAGGSDSIQISSGSVITSVIYSVPNTSFTLVYNATGQYWAIVGVWRVISTNKPQLGPLTLTFSNTSGTYNSNDYYRESDYFVDTTGGSIEVQLDNGIVAKDGQTISFKDPTGSWAAANFTIISFNASIEYPKGIVTNLGNVIFFNTDWSYVQFRYCAAYNVWLLISSL